MTDDLSPGTVANAPVEPATTTQTTTPTDDGSVPLLSNPPAANEWRESLPEEYRGDPTFKPYNDLEGLLKSHKEQAKLIGAKSEPKGLGSMDEYVLNAVEYPEEMQADYEETNKFIQQLAFDGKLSLEQAKLLGDKVHGAVLGLFDKAAGINSKAEEAADKEFEDYLKKEWGENHDANFAKTQSFLAGKVSEEEKGLYEAMSPKAQAFFAKKIFEVASQTYDEDSPVDGGSTIPTSAVDRRKQAQELMREQSRLQQADPLSPRINEIQNQINRLYGTDKS
jgi:hypothetical protein